MFFDDPGSIQNIARSTGFAIFVMPAEMAPDFPATTFYVEPDEKNVIRVDKIRELESELSNKETLARFFVVKHAETMNESAQNAALKLLEEPKENCHLVFLASNLVAFLPTVLSRASIYVLKVDSPLDKAPAFSKEIIDEAKLLLASSPAKTFSLVESWTDKKHKKTRPEILQILSATIELAYKSYFKTKKEIFLKKVPDLITSYENIKANGHIKLQLVAHLC